MRLSQEILTRFHGVRVANVPDDSSTIEVAFPDSDASVVVTEDPTTGRFAASYPCLLSDGKGGWRDDEGFSKDMVSGGVFWILGQVQKHGKVMPEYRD